MGKEQSKLPPPVTGCQNGVVFPISYGGRKVFLARQNNGIYTCFGGKMDSHDKGDIRRTAQREAWEEGFRFRDETYLDVSRWQQSNWHGHTAYFIGKAPRDTHFESHPKNRETNGGKWFSLNDLERAQSEGKLRFAEATLFFARAVLHH